MDLPGLTPSQTPFESEEPFCRQTMSRCKALNVGKGKIQVNIRPQTRTQTGLPGFFSDPVFEQESSIVLTCFCEPRPAKPTHRSGRAVSIPRRSDVEKCWKAMMPFRFHPHAATSSFSTVSPGFSNRIPDAMMKAMHGTTDPSAWDGNPCTPAPTFRKCTSSEYPSSRTWDASTMPSLSPFSLPLRGIEIQPFRLARGALSWCCLAHGGACGALFSRFGRGPANLLTPVEPAKLVSAPASISNRLYYR